MSRQIQIPKREHGYATHRSIILKSDEDLASFLKVISEQTSWNRRETFVRALESESVDFTSESIALFFFSESSGSIKIGAPKAKVKDDTLDIQVSRTPPAPGMFGTTDMAFYGFAFVVKKSKVKKVTFQVGPKDPIHLTL